MEGKLGNLQELAKLHNTHWFECTNPYCERPYAIMGNWRVDVG